MGAESGIDETRDQFPVGMRVLAVDDDLTCLRVLETLLRRCRYHVTIASHAIAALKLLRENKNNFDLVISDVVMPDMDGFKLLELVGLEMDLPVIMLSANGDNRLVMKGISHGACDYLLKPIRIEELKIIWKHVVMRKKFDFESRDHCCSDNQEKPQNETGEGLVSTRTGSSDGKLNKRWKEQSENEIEEHYVNEHDDEDLTTQKKPRVVWSVELHKKFVAAVHQLGIDKAVPKKILDLMNVENLTRENVASHLQKFRIYLKRISPVASQQANMVAAFGSADFPYSQLGSVSGYGNFHTLAGSARFQRVLGSISPGGMLGRFNNSIGNTRGPYSSRMVHLGHVQTASNPISDWQKFRLVQLAGKENGIKREGMPMALKLEQLQHNKGVGCIGKQSTTIENSTSFSTSNGFLNSKPIGCSGNSPFSVPNNPFTLRENPQAAQNHGRCSDNWQTVVQSSAVQPNSLALVDSLKQDSRTNSQCQAAQVSSNPLENIKCGSNQGWDYQKQDQDVSNPPNAIFNSLSSSSPAFGVVTPLDQCFDLKNENLHRSLEPNFVAQQNVVDPLSIQCDVGNSDMETTLKSKEGYLNAQWSLEDLVGVMMQPNSRTNSPCQTAEVTSNALETMKCSSNQGWDDERHFESNHSNAIFNSLCSSSPEFGALDPLDQCFDLKDGMDFVDPLSIQCDTGKPDMETTLKFEQGYLNSQCSLEDLVEAMMQPEDGDLGCAIQLSGHAYDNKFTTE